MHQRPSSEANLCWLADSRSLQPSVSVSCSGSYSGDNLLLKPLGKQDPNILSSATPSSQLADKLAYNAVYRALGQSCGVAQRPGDHRKSCMSSGP